jgi:hypothetical protein
MADRTTWWKEKLFHRFPTVNLLRRKSTYKKRWRGHTQHISVRQYKKDMDLCVCTPFSRSSSFSGGRAVGFFFTSAVTKLLPPGMCRLFLIWSLAIHIYKPIFFLPFLPPPFHLFGYTIRHPTNNVQSHIPITPKVYRCSALYYIRSIIYVHAVISKERESL